MAKTLAPAKTPGVAIARVLRGLGLKQGSDFRVKGEYKGGERTGTYVTVRGAQANQIVADNADLIESQVIDNGFLFYVSIYFTPSGNLWVHVANYGRRARQTHFLSRIGWTENTATEVGGALDDVLKTEAGRVAAGVDIRTRTAAELTF